MTQARFGQYGRVPLHRVAQFGEKNYGRARGWFQYQFGILSIKSLPIKQVPKKRLFSDLVLLILITWESHLWERFG